MMDSIIAGLSGLFLGALVGAGVWFFKRPPAPLAPPTVVHVPVPRRRYRLWGVSPTLWESLIHLDTSIWLAFFAGCFFGLPLGRWLLDIFFPVRSPPRFFHILPEVPPFVQHLPPTTPTTPLDRLAEHLIPIIDRALANRGSPPPQVQEAPRFRVEEATEDATLIRPCWICGRRSREPERCCPQ